MKSEIFEHIFKQNITPLFKNGVQKRCYVPFELAESCCECSEALLEVKMQQSILALLLIQIVFSFRRFSQVLMGYWRERKNDLLSRSNEVRLSVNKLGQNASQ